MIFCEEKNTFFLISVDIWRAFFRSFSYAVPSSSGDSGSVPLRKRGSGMLFLQLLLIKYNGHYADNIKPTSDFTNVNSNHQDRVRFRFKRDSRDITLGEGNGNWFKTVT